MNVTLPNGRVIKNVPEGTTKQQVMDKAIASGLATAEDFGIAPQQSQPQQPQEPPKQDIGFGEGLALGGERGVKQVLGGAGQKLIQWRQSQLNSQIDDLASRMQSGEIPATEESIAQLDQLQNEAVKFAKLLPQIESREMQDRAAFSGVQESAPVSSTIGNIAGQMAALPTPGAPLKIIPQVAKGMIDGGAFGYVQPTVGEESAESNARTGAAIGGAIPLALRPITAAAGGTYRALKGKITGEDASAINYAKEKDIPLLTTDVAAPKTFAGRSGQSLAEKIPIAGTGGIRAEQQAAREKQVQEVAQKYGAASDKEIYDSLIRKSDKISQAAGKRYQEITSSMAGVDIPINRTISTIDAQIDALNRPGAIKNDKLTTLLNGIKSDLTSGAQDINLLRSNRTRFREEVKGKDAVTNTTEKRIIDSVYNSMTDDMDAAVRANLGDVKADSLKQVDKVWARENDEIGKTKLKNIFAKGDVKPEEASKMLFARDPSEVKSLYSSLDGAGRKNARAAIIAKATDAAQGSPEAFLREMRKMKTQNSVFFRGKEGADLRGLINYLDYTRQAGKAALVTPTGQQAIQLGAPVGVMADITTTGGMGTAGFAGFGVLARAYESPAVRDIMAKMSSVEKGSTAFEKLAAKLEAQLNMAATRTQGAQE